MKAAKAPAALDLKINGRNIIKRWEGLRLKGYLCPAGTPTVGWGHTGTEVYVGMKITMAHAERLLTADVQWAEQAIERYVTAYVRQNQFDALVSFIFNIGSGAFAGSTALKRINNLNWQGAAEAMTWWNKARVSGALTILPGLVDRRAEEAALFLQQPVAPITVADIESDRTQEMPQAVTAEGNELPSLAKAAGVIRTVAGSGGALGVVAGFFNSLHPAAQAALIFGGVAVVGAAAFYIWRRIEDRKAGLR